MPIKTKQSTPGLLAFGKLGETIDAGNFPDLSDKVEQITDVPLLHGTSLASFLIALFRDYSFLASAYLLEPCHLHRMRDPNASDYGLGRNVLPKAIAYPLSILAERLNAKPFMEYALSYA